MAARNDEEGPSGSRPLSIGQVARLAGVGVETIRFYERQGLIASPPRRASGYRQYGPDAVARLRFIRRAKALGFTLREIGELLELRVSPDRSCADVRRHAEAKIADIDARVRTLVEMRRALETLSEACADRGPEGPCPILEALDMEGWGEAAAPGEAPGPGGVSSSRRRR